MVQKEGESHESSLNKNLLKTYSSGKKAVDDIGIALESGEVFGFLGPNGAGKTTTVCSAVCLRPREEAAGCLTSTLPEPGKLHQVSGVVREQAQMYDYMTGLENLMFYGNLFGMDAAESKKRGANHLFGCDQYHSSRLRKSADDRRSATTRRISGFSDHRPHHRSVYRGNHGKRVDSFGAGSRPDIVGRDSPERVCQKIHL